MPSSGTPRQPVFRLAAICCSVTFDFFMAKPPSTGSRLYSLLHDGLISGEEPTTNIVRSHDLVPKGAIAGASPPVVQGSSAPVSSQKSALD